jgi:thiamine biosynthesis lipoprotein
MAPSPASPWLEQCRLLYAGIPVTVAFQAADEALAAEIWAGFERIDEIFNDHRDDSELGRINAAAGGTFALSAPLAAAFEAAEHLQQISRGAFSPASGPLRRLWRQAARDDRAPDADALTDALAALDPAAWQRDGNRLTVRDPRVRFDFGGLVKGMAVDQAMAVLLDRGVPAALVQCGGETACRGLSRRGRPHVLGIPDPLAPDERLWCTLRDPGDGLSASTSANYRNPLCVAGHACHHIFLPQSGRPVTCDLLSVSVVFPRWGCNGLADGLATAGSVLGWRELLPLVVGLGGQALVIAREDGRIAQHASAGWQSLTA